MAASLQNTFQNAVAVFNSTFTHRPPYTQAELDNFGRFYDDHVKVTTPGQRTMVGKQAVLSDFAQSAPLSFGPAFTSLEIHENPGTVSGDGPYHDTDGGIPNTVQIHFDFKWVQTPAGWIVTDAKAG